MKLHIPSPLRAALMACMAAAAPIGTTFASGALVVALVSSPYALAEQGDSADDPLPVSYNDGRDISLSDYDGKYIELELNGKHYGNSDYTFSANIKVGDTHGLYIYDAYPGKTITYTGIISGSGNITYNKIDLSGYQKWIFTGDMSKYTGTISFTATTSKATGNALTLSGGGTIGAASVTVTGADFNVGNASKTTSLSGTTTVSGGTLNVVAGAQTVTFGGVVTTDTLKVAGGAVAGFTGSVTVGSTLEVYGTLSGNITLSEGATLKFDAFSMATSAASVSTTLEEGKYSVTYGGMSVDTSNISGYSENSLAQTGGSVVQEGTVINGFKLDNTYEWKGWGSAATGDAPNLLEQAKVQFQVDSGAIALASGTVNQLDGTQGNGVALLDYVQDATLNVYGGKDSAPTGASDSPVDSWIYVDGATLGKVVGGSYANNWNTGTQADFYGDSHINIVGGAEVNYVIGANYKDGDGSGDTSGAVFYGDTYISISEDSQVLGSVIGGGTTAHNDTAAVSGNTNVWIYSPLEASSQVPTLDSLSGQQFVAGGGAWGTNSGGAVKVTGDTNVNIILKDYSGSADTFGKKVIGGSFGGTTDNGCVIVHGDSDNQTGGNTSVTIDAGNKDITFSAAVIGGSNTLKENKSITQVGKATVSLTGGNYSEKIVGGHYIEATGGTAAATLTGGAEVSITSATVGGTVYGGSYTANNGAVTQGAVSVTLGSGSNINGNVYAAGGKSADSTAAITTASTKVTIADGATIADTSVISGGYENVTANTTVTGAQELVANGSISVGTIEQFTSIEVATGKTATTTTLGVTKPLTLSTAGEGTGGTLTATSLVFSAAPEGTDGALLTVNSGMTFTLASDGATIDVTALSDALLDASITLITWADETSVWSEDVVQGINLTQTAGGNAALWISGNSLMVGMVPEPTTATLSLLALAGLCARRRRRA